MLKVLVAPLDWGLGHATRCIPIIKELLNQRCIVVIAAVGPQKAILQEEFPTLPFVEIPGYRVKYGKNRAFTILRLIGSVPKILIRVKQENAWLRRFADREEPDLVLSDNRYGLHLPGVVCVFITHQLTIRTPFGPVTDRILQRLSYFAIRHFSVCWVPDGYGPDSLAGKLSHPRKLPSIPIRYIGWLSRFGTGAQAGTQTGTKAETQSEAKAETQSEVTSHPGETSQSADGIQESGPPELLVLLSGPEPQRTILEKMIFEQGAESGCRIILVRGLPDGTNPPRRLAGMLIYDHLPGTRLESLILGSPLILSRAGYSTVMDLMRLRKKAIVIPTPGQTEQEYLGEWLAKTGLAICLAQKGFSLKEAMLRAGEFAFATAHAGFRDSGNELLKKEILAVLAQAAPSALG